LGLGLAHSCERLASIDLERKLLVTAPPQGLYGFRKGQRFYFLNILDELDEPGEWFLDRAALRLYLWPSQSLDNPRRLPEVLLSVSGSPLVTFQDLSHVTFHGFTLEATRGSAVEIQGGTGSRISKCVIRNIGNYGVTIRHGSNHGVVGCTVFDTGDGGVMLEAGDRQTLTPAGHFVEGCHFSGQGRWSKCYVPAVLMNGVGLRASRNLIHDHPHCAILFNGNDHLVELNEIHHIALEQAMWALLHRPGLLLPR
jgi:hypothetical protein